MEGTIDAQRTPAIWGVSDLAPALEIYPNDAFETSDGLMVLPGNPEIGDFRHRVIGVVENQIAQFPSVTGIYSTEDSLDNQEATYSAYIRVRDRELIPWLERFPVPILYPGQTSWSWSRLRIHKKNIRALRSNDVYTKQQTEALIASYFLQFQSTAIPSGVALMTDGKAVVELPAVRVTSRIFVTSNDPGITGSLRVAQEDIGEDEGFIIRSTGEGDTGAVSWLVLNT